MLRFDPVSAPGDIGQAFASDLVTQSLVMIIDHLRRGATHLDLRAYLL